jgi:hypothetical protein
MEGTAAALLPPINDAPYCDIVRLRRDLSNPKRRPPDRAQVQNALTGFVPFRVTPKSSRLFGSATGKTYLTCENFGASILAQICAARLGLIPADAAQDVLSRQLSALSHIPLFRGALPFRTYPRDTDQLADLTFHQQKNSGWSGPEILFLATAQMALIVHHPKLAQKATALVARWSLKSVIHNRQIWTVSRDSMGNFCKVLAVNSTEGWNGEQTALNLGLDVAQTQCALSPAGVPFVQPVVRSVSRSSTRTISHPSGLILNALLFGPNGQNSEALSHFHRLSRARFQSTAQATAPGEWHPSADTSAMIGFVGETGALAISRNKLARKKQARGAKSALCLTSTAFGFDALFNSPYTLYLTSFVDNARTSNGWLAGCDPQKQVAYGGVHPMTNLLVLLSMHYRAFGPLIPMS